MVSTPTQFFKTMIFEASISNVKTDTAMVICCPVLPYYSVAGDTDCAICDSFLQPCFRNEMSDLIGKTLVLRRYSA